MRFITCLNTFRVCGHVRVRSHASPEKACNIQWKILQWKISPYMKYIIVTKQKKNYDFACVINCTCELTCRCACACACDHTRPREQYVNWAGNSDMKTDRYHFRAGKIRYSGERNSVLLKASSGACCAPCNFVLIVTLRGTSVCLTMYLTLHQMK